MRWWRRPWSGWCRRRRRDDLFEHCVDPRYRYKLTASANRLRHLPVGHRRFRPDRDHQRHHSDPVRHFDLLVTLTTWGPPRGPGAARSASLRAVVLPARDPTRISTSPLTTRYYAPSTRQTSRTTGSSTMKPADFTSHFPTGPQLRQFPSPAPPSFSKAAPTGSATLASTFDGTNPNGTWKSVRHRRTHHGDGGGSIADRGGWSLNITTAATAGGDHAQPGIEPEPFVHLGRPTTRRPLRPTVTSSGSACDIRHGGLRRRRHHDFRLRGGGPQRERGRPPVHRRSRPRGPRLIGDLQRDADFVTSKATLTQEVDNHTVVSGNNFANPGTLDPHCRHGTPACAGCSTRHTFLCPG